MILFIIFSYDVWFYFSHILLHQPFLYHKIHKYHHSIDYKQLRFINAYTGHILESFFQGIGFILPFLFFKITWFSFFVSLVFINIRGMIRHDYRLISYFGNHHILHHANLKYNFGEYWLDYVFQTQIQI